ncbi:CAF17-like 4Fe-4S cluster assembly/insertion protein YgfZ [Pararhodospirillum oryzae]|uniref:Glycine cleavage system protein T n=1 Tax=Pararhodospirillum oryzae TaxID=478448 RepID=A0A512HBG7_9PROT|nr:folate-binding protein YgfZ [Pararhodospirillum oryzae]GEO82797.1 glycine cleavage system protein T [Pararhodospirillum oryzae]
MADLACVPLPERALLAVEGADRVAFLNGLVTVRLERLAPGRALWGGLLSPHGRVVHEFFLIDTGDAIVLEGEAARLDDLARRLGRFRLRAAVTLTPWPGGRVMGLGDPEAPARLGLAPTPGACRSLPGGALALVDPRLAEAGVRLIVPEGAALPDGVREDDTPGARVAWHAHRVGLGLPEGAAELPPEAVLPLEAGFEELGAVDFDKGCYLGQEMTARTHYRRLIRRRVLPVSFEGAAPAPGATLLTTEGAEAGVFHASGAPGLGLAVLRQENAVEGRVLHEAQGGLQGEASVVVHVPGWVRSLGEQEG